MPAQHRILVFITMQTLALTKEAKGCLRAASGLAQGHTLTAAQGRTFTFTHSRGLQAYAEGTWK